MTANARPCAFSKLVDGHFAGRIAPRSERRLRHHLDLCEGCRVHYGRWLALAEIDRTVPSRKARLAVGLGLRRPLRPSRAPALGLALVAALAGVTAVVASGHTPPGPLSLLAPTIPAPSSEAEFAVYSVGRDGARAALLHTDEEIAPNQSLGFAYAKAAGTKHLMIFGVDERRRMVWYRPGVVESSESLPLLPITHGELLHELSEAFTQTLEEGTLQLFAVFTNREDLRLSEVETAVANTPRTLTLGLPGCEVRDIRLNVRASLQ
jgi:hypothetical protein